MRRKSTYVMATTGQSYWSCKMPHYQYRLLIDHVGGRIAHLRKPPDADLPIMQQAVAYLEQFHNNLSYRGGVARARVALKHLPHPVSDHPADPEQLPAKLFYPDFILGEIDLLAEWVSTCALREYLTHAVGAPIPAKMRQALRLRENIGKNRKLVWRYA